MKSWLEYWSIIMSITVIQSLQFKKNWYFLVIHYQMPYKGVRPIPDLILLDTSNLRVLHEFGCL